MIQNLFSLLLQQVYFKYLLWKSWKVIYLCRFLKLFTIISHCNRISMLTTKNLTLENKINFHIEENYIGRCLKLTISVTVMMLFSFTPTKKARVSMKWPSFLFALALSMNIFSIWSKGTLYRIILSLNSQK